MENKTAEKINHQQKIYSTDLTSHILLIRHGETNFNHDFFIKGPKIKSDPNYINAPLNETGKSQAIIASKIFENLDVEIVYVSPLFRSIETAILLFKNHPNQKNIIIKIHPLLTELISSTHNFTYDIQSTKKFFNSNSKIKIDWTIFDKIFQNEIDQDFYFFEYIDLLNETQKKIQKQKLIEKHKKKEIKECLGNLGKYMMDIGLKKLESFNHLFQRCVKFKEFLKKNNNDDNGKKIVIVAHKCFTNIFTSNSCYNKKNITEFPKDSYNLQNCEAISIFL